MEQPAFDVEREEVPQHLLSMPPQHHLERLLNIVTNSG